MPETPGQILLVILESLAFRYREAVDELSEIRCRKPDVLHIISGGGQNRLLNQFGANTTRIPVHVGPFEATSVGKILVQMIVVKDLARLAEGRALVNVSFPTETYLPAGSDKWEEHCNQWKSVIIWTNQLVGN
jgi:sugar (pentulose or hexulose) kinase